MLAGVCSLSTPSPGASPELPTNLRPDKGGRGAAELVGQYNPLNIGHRVFASDLADPNLRANQLNTTDLGVNWYWTLCIKV